MTNVGLTANVVHCFQENELKPSTEAGNNEINALRPNEELGAGTATIRDVPDDELELAVEWDEGSFVIWKNCWLGMIERVEYNVSVRLSNGSVVVPEDCGSLEVPVGTSSDGGRAGQNTPTRQRNATNRNRQQTTPSSTTAASGDTQNTSTPVRLGTVPAPAMLTVGQQIITKKGNLRRGNWIYGSYDPTISPIGIVVDVQVAYMGINWCCQNIAVEEFVAVPSPPSWLENSELHHLRKFKKSTRGLRTPATGDGVSNITVGDKVRFKDLGEAMKKYDGRSVEEGGLGQGRVYKIPRTESLGFDVNTFMVELTSTWVEVQWQDLSVSRHQAKDLTQYPNVDEHELWPGELVIVKNDMGEDPTTASLPAPRTNSQQVGNTGPSEPPAEVVIPKAVGVVQSADAKERVAKVRWFEDPQVELAGTFLVPGSHTGTLKEEVEEVSFYEVVAHQALGIRRGDFVILLPESKPQQEGEGNLDSPDQETVGSMVQQMSRQFGFFRNMMAASPSATLQSISNFIAGTLGATSTSENAGPRRANATEHLDFMNGPTDWFGEVVDLGLDGLVAVRLGALDGPRDVKLPIERLTVIFSEPADIDGWLSDDEESTDDEYDSQDDDDDEYGVWNHPVVLEEVTTYEGGERIQNDGGDEAWLTDTEDEMDVDVRSQRAPSGMGNHDQIMSDPIDTSDGEQLLRESGELSKPLAESPAAPQSTLSRQTTSNQPEPEAFTIPAGAEKPPGFAILEDSIPADHAFASTPPTPNDSAFLRRVNKEHNILQTSLPEGIFVRTWESRFDLLRVLIIGPLNTPYELAPFVFDFHLGSDFPAGPPKGHFHSWTGGVGRVNPNLYEEGKICLSLLGTWHAQSYSEGWTVGSSVLQLLVSLMGLVLVKEPYYSKSSKPVTLCFIVRSVSWWFPKGRRNTKICLNCMYYPNSYIPLGCMVGINTRVSITLLPLRPLPPTVPISADTNLLTHPSHLNT